MRNEAVNFEKCARAWNILCKYLAWSPYSSEQFLPYDQTHIQAGRDYITACITPCLTSFDYISTYIYHSKTSWLQSRYFSAQKKCSFLAEMKMALWKQVESIQAYNSNLLPFFSITTVLGMPSGWEYLMARRILNAGTPSIVYGIIDDNVVRLKLVLFQFLLISIFIGLYYTIKIELCIWFRV